jgi:small subunit ribosomal protein S6
VGRLYEAMYVVRPDVSEEDLAAAMQRAADTVTQAGATIQLNEVWDRRELAYEIDDTTRGTFCLMYFESAGDTVELLRRELALDEQVLRAGVFVANPHAMWRPMPPEEPEEEQPEAEAGTEEAAGTEGTEEPAEDEAEAQEDSQASEADAAPE